MAKKLLNPLEDPPTASSSDDDEVETSSGEEDEQISDSSSEEDEPKDPAKIPSTKTLKTPSAAPAKPDPGSETDSDSKSEPAEKPIAVTTAKSKKKEGNDLPEVKSGKKRPSEATTSKDMHVKRTKKVSGDDEKKSGEDNKKPYFQRLWSEEDDISLLQGMIDFKAETVKSPVKSKKIEKKKKLDSEVEEEEVLGSDGIVLESAVVKSNGKVKKVESLKPEGDKVEEDKEVVILGGDLESPNWFEKSFLVRFIASLGVDEYSVKQKWSKVPVETKKRIEEKLKLVEAKEYELLLKKTDILKEVTSVISEAI